jgi:hypothetical protein
MNILREGLVGDICGSASGGTILRTCVGIIKPLLVMK